MSTRPRRTTRPTKPVVAPAPKAGPSSVVNLSHLLHNPKSAITRLEITDILNAETWLLLDEDARATLSTLLPPTAFDGYINTVDSSHPSLQNAISNPQIVDPNAMDTSSLDAPAPSTSNTGITARGETTASSGSDLPLSFTANLDFSVFKDAHFVSAAHTFQDHIYSGWKTDAHAAKVQKYEDGIRDGSLAAPWKDDVWEREHAPVPLGKNAGDAANVTFGDLLAGGALLVGDVLSYRRNFSVIDIAVEKDCVIEAIHPNTSSMSVLMPAGDTKNLPPSLLTKTPGAISESDTSIRRTNVTSPTNLETAILDVDTRVPRDKRPNGNAWKCLTVWRWSSNGTASASEQFGRESYGTLFYVRGCFYQDM
ncbi:hypothetical protein CYLTODRAFT_425718 [Cylindrobasidium torrendii FP15055 ss-10]|uniref:ASX DEUBAD domain-containing protein n=1 Tax=Cylindrobasidium torrendii FP15055 ss-10 TaxID=1314674 RepID=A0A0D7B100_9AGAR|nr:hypothetical protein CYLTODRAFT_425718 [Cylindrobasidium torrendii FP15055 ss-10]